MAQWVAADACNRAGELVIADTHEASSAGWGQGACSPPPPGALSARGPQPMRPRSRAEGVAAESPAPPRLEASRLAQALLPASGEHSSRGVSIQAASPRASSGLHRPPTPAAPLQRGEEALAGKYAQLGYPHLVARVTAGSQRAAKEDRRWCEKPISECAFSYIEPKEEAEEGCVILTSREISKIAMERMKRDKVSNLLGRVQQNRGKQAEFADLYSSRAKDAKATSTTRDAHGQESLAGGDPFETRFLRKRDRLTEFVEAFMAQTHILRK